MELLIKNKNINYFKDYFYICLLFSSNKKIKLFNNNIVY